MRFGLGILGLRQTRVRARAIDLGFKMHSFEAVGSNKHIDGYTHAQCSHASVGLNQARSSQLLLIVGYHECYMILLLGDSASQQC